METVALLRPVRRPLRLSRLAALIDVFQLDKPAADDREVRRHLAALDELFRQTEAAVRSMPRIDHDEFLKRVIWAQNRLAAASLDADAKILAAASARP